MYGVNIQNHVKRNGKDKEKVIKVSHKRNLGQWFSDGQMTGEMGLEEALKARGTLIILWMEIGLSSLNTFSPQKWFKLRVIVGSGMKKEFLSLFEFNECTVHLLVPVVFHKE